MKKILVVLVALALPSSLLFSQEADEPGTGAELTIVPRLDLGGAFPKDGGNGSFDLGNSSLYSLFEGNLTENISFSICNHWASFGMDEGAWDSSAYTDLYKYTLRTDWTDWCDWVWLRYDMDGIWFSLGKDTMYIGGMEYDEYDYDCHAPLMSTLWANFSPYQWQAAFGWDLSDNTTLSMQIATSPYGEHPFSSGLYSYAAKWVGSYGFVDNIWTVDTMDTGDGFYTLISLGQTFHLSDSFDLTVDWSNAACDENDFLLKGNSAYASLKWMPSDKLELIVKGGLENSDEYPGLSGSNTFKVAGCAANWYPLTDNENLRLHASFAYNEILDGWFASAGVMYYLNFHIGR